MGEVALAAIHRAQSQSPLLTLSWVFLFFYTGLLISASLTFRILKRAQQILLNSQLTCYFTKHLPATHPHLPDEPRWNNLLAKKGLTLPSGLHVFQFKDMAFGFSWAVSPCQRWRHQLKPKATSAHKSNLYSFNLPSVKGPPQIHHLIGWLSCQQSISSPTPCPTWINASEHKKICHLSCQISATDL